MHKTIISFARTTFLVMLLLMPSLAMADKQAWVEYQEDTRTLTFHNDKLRALTTATGKYDFDGDDVNNFDHWRDADPVKVVFREEFSEVLPRYCSRWFYNKKNLKEIEGIEYLNTSKTSDMPEMFSSCESLTSLDLTHFVTDYLSLTSGMFYSCSNLKNIYVSEDFSLPRVYTYVDMFYGCTSLPNFDKSVVTKEKANYIDEYYDINGRRIESLRKGLNIVKRGNKAIKVIIK